MCVIYSRASHYQSDPKFISLRQLTVFHNMCQYVFWVPFGSTFGSHGSFLLVPLKFWKPFSFGALLAVSHFLWPSMTGHFLSTCTCIYIHMQK